MDDRAAVEACHAAFVEIVAEEGNSVWTWYIANTTGPLRLSDQKIDRIVANPPWVSMADIQAEVRKRDLERFADRDLDLWTGGRNAPHFDIAQLFIKRARQLYLQDPDRDPAAWIVKKSALRAGKLGPVSGMARNSPGAVARSGGRTTVREGAMPAVAVSCSKDGGPFRSLPEARRAHCGVTVRTADPRRTRLPIGQESYSYSRIRPHRCRASHRATSTGD